MPTAAPPIGFLDCPQEIRQQILVHAFEDVLEEGVMGTQNYASYMAIQRTPRVYALAQKFCTLHRLIKGDLPWVVRTVLDRFERESVKQEVWRRLVLAPRPGRRRMSLMDVGSSETWQWDLEQDEVEFWWGQEDR
ncbi:hypothetical protein FKW77_000481 [Venturia effusa]|uniref:Uncharacterized protein n=1 Tax=Venturia effusa TaxID=50376 RepID=A0A517L2K7_9PEZI|nr:hypothetical protein FKW77_000481 [Venturia effusa]